MLSHRFTPYIVTICIITFFSILYIGYEAYQRHLAFEAFMSKVVEIKQDLDKDGKLLEHTHGGTLGKNDTPNPNRQERQAPPSPVKVGIYSPGEIVNIKVDKSKPPVIVPASEMVKQRVQTPDGKIHTIWVPPGHEVKEGAMLSESFFNNPRPLPKEAFAKSGSIKKSDIPEGEDVETYIQKTILANAYGVSMKEIESMIESGKIQLPSVVSRSPVEEFIDDDHLFHNHRNPSQDSWGEGINVPRGDRSTAGSVYTILDTDTPKVRSDIPLSLPDNTIVDEAARSNPISDLDKQLTPG